MRATWAKGTCDGKQPFDLRFLVVADGPHLEVRGVDGNGPLLVAADQQACTIHVKERIEICPSCTPWMGEAAITYDLVLKASGISGSAQYEESGDWEGAGKCRGTLRLRGKVAPITNGALEFSASAASKAFASMWSTAECHLPRTQGRSAEVVVVVGRKGGFESVSVDGARYQLREVCLEKYWGLLEYPNPSGKEQSFSVHVRE